MSLAYESGFRPRRGGEKIMNAYRAVKEGVKAFRTGVNDARRTVRQGVQFHLGTAGFRYKENTFIKDVVPEFDAACNKLLEEVHGDDFFGMLVRLLQDAEQIIRTAGKVRAAHQTRFSAQFLESKVKDKIEETCILAFAKMSAPIDTYHPSETKTVELLVPENMSRASRIVSLLEMQFSRSQNKGILTKEMMGRMRKIWEQDYISALHFVRTHVIDRIRDPENIKRRAELPYRKGDTKYNYFETLEVADVVPMVYDYLRCGAHIKGLPEHKAVRDEVTQELINAITGEDINTIRVVLGEHMMTDVSLLQNDHLALHGDLRQLLILLRKEQVGLSKEGARDALTFVERLDALPLSHYTWMLSYVDELGLLDAMLDEGAIITKIRRTIEEKFAQVATLHGTIAAERCMIHREQQKVLAKIIPDQSTLRELTGPTDNIAINREIARGNIPTVLDEIAKRAQTKEYEQTPEHYATLDAFITSQLQMGGMGELMYFFHCVDTATKNKELSRAQRDALEYLLPHDGSALDQSVQNVCTDYLLDLIEVDAPRAFREMYVPMEYLRGQLLLPKHIAEVKEAFIKKIQTIAQTNPTLAVEILGECERALSYARLGISAKEHDPANHELMRLQDRYMGFFFNEQSLAELKKKILTRLIH